MIIMKTLLSFSLCRLYYCIYAVFALLLLSHPLQAQVLENPPSFTFQTAGILGFDAEVRDVIQITSGAHTGKLIVVGDFSDYRGTAVNRIVRLNTDGTLDGSFNTLPGTFSAIVNSVKIDGMNRIVIGGDFNVMNYRRVARMDIDGNLDATFVQNTALTGTNGIRAIAIDPSDNSIVAVGGFTTPENRVIRFSNTGAVDATFGGNVTMGLDGSLPAEAVVIDNMSRIIIGGAFTNYNGTARGRLVRLNANGTLDNTFLNALAGANGPIYSILIDASNRILIGGDFTNFNGTGRNRIARLTTTGALEAVGTFNPGTGANNVINSMAIEPTTNRIVLGGGFSTYNGQGRNNIARINDNGSLDFAFNPGTGFTGGVVKVMIETPTPKLVVGGQFTAFNSGVDNRNRLARFFYASGATNNGRIFSERTQNDGQTTDVLEVVLGPASPTAPLDVEEWVSTVANGTDFTLGTHYTIAGGPVPTGMTLAIQKVNNKTARIRITGNAAAHTNANDVTNLRIIWQNAALLGNNAAGVENLNTDATTGANILYTIDFRDPATAVYSGPMFTETFINNGALSGTRTVTITNAMFRSSLATGATFTNGADFSVAGLPAGMGITVTKTGANTATFTLTGNAAAHAAANSGNLIITWNDAAIEGMTMVGTNIAGLNGVMNTITFLDPGTAAYSGSVFPEAVPPNTGTVTQTRTVTLTNDNWLNSIANGTVLTGGGTHYTLSGTAVPAGLTFRATKTSNTVVTLDFTGTAAAHANANDVAGIMVNFANAVLESNNAAGVTGLAGNLSIDFQDPTPTVVYSGTTFSEDAPTDNGAVPTTRTITLSNDTWTMPDGPLTPAVHYTVTGVPAGLTATLTKMGAVLTIGLTGNAAPHTIAANTSAMQFTFLNAAVTSNNAAGVTNLNGQNLSVTFADAITMFTNAMPPSGSTSIAYTHNFTTNGSPASTFALQSGTLPPGLTLTAGGVLSGTPTMAGTFMYTIRASNGVGTGFFDQTYTTTITAGVAPTMFTSAAPPSGLPATPYTHTFVANGSPAPNSYTVVAGALPGGLTLNAATGVLSGTPAANGVFNFTVRANNGVGTFDQPYTINIGAGTTTITSGPPPNGNLMTAYTHTFTGNGSPLANNFTVSAGALPPGLTLNAGTGVLSGTPTALGTYNFTIQADNGFGNATQAYSVQIDPQNVAPTAFTSGTPPGTGTTGSPYLHTFAANGAPTPFYTLASGSLPPGLSLNPITGALSGTPTATGTYSFTVRALNIAGNTVSSPVTITVGNPPAPPPTTPSASGSGSSSTQPAPPTAFALGTSPISIGSSVGLPYALPVTANGNPTPTYAVSGGALPPGLTMSPSGVLSGTPTMEGTYTFTVQATNSQGSMPATFVMRVGPPRPLITSVSQSEGSIGDRVVLTGYNLNNAQGVLFGGVPATSFTVDSPNQITAVVGNGATGPITVVTPIGSALSDGIFTYLTPLVPTLSPQQIPSVVSGPANYPIVINGTNLSPFGGFAVEPADRPGVRLPVEVVSLNSTQATLLLPVASRIPGVNRLIYTLGNNTISTTFAVVPAPAPFITSLSTPSTTASGQAFSTVLTGGNYFTNGLARLTVNEQPAVGQVFNQNRAVVEIPRSLNIIGSDVRVRLTNYDGQFTEATVRVNSLPGPIINAVTPVWMGNSQQLILRGNNYQQGAVVRLQGREVPVVALSPTEITVQVPANFPRPTPTEEAWVIEVENPDTQNYAYRVIPSILLPPANSTASCATCPAPALPELIDVTPGNVATGEGDYVVAVRGRNIAPSASFRVEPVLGQGAYPAVVESISPDRAVLRLPAASRKAGPQRIVMNSGRNVASTGFMITPGRRPVITSLSVPSTVATGQAFTTRVTGSGFYTTPPAQITSDGRILKSRILSDTEALVEIPADANTPGPTVRLRLTNADEQFAETSLGIEAADPLAIQSVQPIRFTDNTIEYLVRGRGFYPTSRVTINDQDVRVRSQQPTEMVVEYPRSAPQPRLGESVPLRVRNVDGQCASYCMDAPLFTPPTPRIGSNQKGSSAETSSLGGTSNSEVFPNPTDSDATIQFLLEKTGTVRISVKDMLGREVLVLPEETIQSGWVTKNLSLGTLPQGVYLVEVQQESRRNTMKIVKQR